MKVEVITPERFHRESKDDFAGLKEELKAVGGYYSPFKKGFIFRKDVTPFIKHEDLSQEPIAQVHDDTAPVSVNTPMPPISDGQVITLSKPTNKKGFSINGKQYNLFKKSNRIVIGSDVITDGYIAVKKTEDTIRDINKTGNANITENPDITFSKLYNGENTVVLSGDPKLYDREVDEFINGKKTGKKILQKLYVFKINDKLYGVQQKHLDAFNNGTNTFLGINIPH